MSREEFEKEFNEKVESLKKEIIEKYFNDVDENNEKTLEEIIAYGDEYFYIEKFNEVALKICEFDIVDKYLFKTGNFYLTRQEADFETERRKVIRELKRYAVKNPVWNKGYHYHFIYYFSDFECISDRQTVYPIGDIVFESGDILMQAINEVGEDRVKKYYLRMED